MERNTNKINLLEIMPFEQIQIYQNRLADLFNISCVTIDETGAITEQSKCSDFCNQIADSKEYKNICKKCKQAAFKKIKKEKKTLSFKCFTGLKFDMTPIIVNNEVIAGVAVGQVFTEEPDAKTIMEATQILGISKAEYISRTKDIKRIPNNEFELISKAFYINALNVSNLLFKDNIINQNIIQETFLSKLSRQINISDNKDEVLKLICTETAKIFNVQRVYIVKMKNNKSCLLYDYRTSDKIQGMVDVINNADDYQKHLTYWFKKLLNKINALNGTTVFSQDSNGIDYDNPTQTKLTSAKSGIASLIESKNKTYVGIVFEEYIKDRIWTDSEKRFIKTLTNTINIIVTKNEMKKNLIAQVEREKYILNNLPFASWIKDIDGKYTFINQAYADDEGLTIENVIGKTDFDLYPKDIAKLRHTIDLEVIEKNQQISTNEEQEINGKKRWVQKFKAPIKDENGDIIAIAGCLLDITDKNEMDRLKDEFISTISHELRTPLTVIRGGLELIAQGITGEIPPKAKELLDIANSNSKRLYSLINDILDLSKIKAGKMEYKILLQKVLPIIEKTIAEIKPYAASCEVNIEFENNTPESYIEIDDSKLSQILSNLISNAIKYSPKHENVVIKSFEDNNSLIIGISDFGMQIPEEAKDLIFNKFSQIDSSNTREKNGTGLGLNISKLLTEEMNGKIYFKSNENITTFFLEFPLIKLD